MWWWGLSKKLLLVHIENSTNELSRTGLQFPVDHLSGGLLFLLLHIVAALDLLLQWVKISVVFHVALLGAARSPHLLSGDLFAELGEMVHPLKDLVRHLLAL